MHLIFTHCMNNNCSEGLNAKVRHTIYVFDLGFTTYLTVHHIVFKTPLLHRT